METRKTVFEKIALNSEKYDFALVDDLIKRNHRKFFKKSCKK